MPVLFELTEEQIARIAVNQFRLPGVDVGPKRPANVENLSRPFVRINSLGGPWRYVALWYPRLITES